MNFEEMKKTIKENKNTDKIVMINEYGIPKYKIMNICTILGNVEKNSKTKIVCKVIEVVPNDEDGNLYCHCYFSRENIDGMFQLLVILLEKSFAILLPMLGKTSNDLIDIIETGDGVIGCFLEDKKYFEMISDLGND